MLGTFAGALDARKINTADVRGDVEEENKVLIIRRVHRDVSPARRESRRSPRNCGSRSQRVR
jgi:hypothetical protein